MGARLEKVTAFVTHGSGAATRLLVLSMPGAAPQVPSGTVLHGEAVEEAVVREVREETEVAPVVLARLLSNSVALPQDARVVLEETKLLSEPRAEAEPEWRQIPRGWLVGAGEERDGFTEIWHKERDLRDGSTYWEVRGWAASSALGRGYTRHIYHCAAEPDEAQEWSGSGGFRCEWVPLDPKPALVAGQDEWLEAVYEALRSQT